jgi:putative SbcD/Mre11-related phosphoesterase
MTDHRKATTPSATRAEVRPGVWLDARCALWLAAERLLVIADLHWGYAASHRARGNLLPLWGDEEIAARLESLLADYEPAEMIWLGDVLHDVEGRGNAERFLREARTPITLLAGNHDRRWTVARERTLVRGNYFFHHGDNSPEIPVGHIEILGHHHPAVSWYDGAGGRLKLPALVAGARRLILPAFSPWAAGTAWNGDLGEGERLWAVSAQRIFPVASGVVARSNTTSS